MEPDAPLITGGLGLRWRESLDDVAGREVIAGGLTGKALLTVGFGVVAALAA